MPESLEARVSRLVADVFDIPCEQVTLATSRDSVAKWDSLGTVNLLMAIDSEFGVALGVEEAMDLLSVEIIVAVLRERGVE